MNDQPTPTALAAAEEIWRTIESGCVPSNTKIAEMFDRHAAPLREALEAQALKEAFTEEDDQFPAANDPRYTPYIGEAAGLRVPDFPSMKRWRNFCDKVKQLRAAALAQPERG